MHEVKFDGYRMQIDKAGKVTIFTRNGHNWTDRFPLVLFVCVFNIDYPRHIGWVFLRLQDALVLDNNLLLTLDRDKLFAFRFWGGIRLGIRNEGWFPHGLRGRPHGFLRRGEDHIDRVADRAGSGISVQIIEP